MAARSQKLIGVVLIACGLGVSAGLGDFRLKAEATRLDEKRDVRLKAEGTRLEKRDVRLKAEGTRLDDARRGFRLQAEVPAPRIVSLVPALTEMLFAIGAGSGVIGVSNFDAFPPEVSMLPRVGALLDPDTERILSLRPTLVAIYGSQTDLQAQFARAGIRTYVYRHGGLTTIYQSLRELGDATNHRPEADRVVRDLRARIDAVRARVAGRPRPRVLLVIGRQPKTLREIYVSGGRGFLHEMLGIAGGQNVFADIVRESAQPSQETLIARAPDVVIEVHAEGMFKTTNADAERAVWSALPSLPAVRNRRVHVLVGQYLVVPGPRFAEATETLARTLHPEAFNRLR